MSARITTWADGFGTWHASVPMNDAPFPCHAYAVEARRAIVGELRARGDLGVGYRVKVELERVTGHQTAIYREVSA